MKSPSEPEQVLVPRLVANHAITELHICMADSRFADGAIVTLQALCDGWALGILSRMPIVEWRIWTPDAVLCMTCFERWMRRFA